MSQQYLAIFLIFFVFISCQTSVVTEEPEVITFIEHLYGGTGGVTVGPDGDIYVSDFGPWLGGLSDLDPWNRVYKISPEGGISIYADGIFGASGSKFDVRGNFYQSNVRKGIITKISPEGVVDSIFADGMTSPVGISLDDDGNIYVNNCDAHKIVKIDAQGLQTDFCVDTLLRCPNGLTRDDDGNFYVANFYDGNLVRISPDGDASLLAEIPGNNNGHVVYHQNYLYVIARSAHQIYKVSLQGDIELFAGNGNRGRKNGSRLESSFSYPNDLDISPDGRHMYINEISDTLSDHRILTPMSVRRILMN